MLHITNGGATKAPLERSGVPGRFFSWDDILHDGPTPLLSGDEWLRVRAKYSETSVTNARPTAASASASILARISVVIGE